MTVPSPASRLATQAGRELLRPVGLKQRGRSRLWLDDHAWWVGVVELGSPQWSQGSRLSVGVMWLWHVTPFVRFDVLHPGHESSDFLNEAQFYESVRRQCLLAAERVKDYRQRFRNIASSAEFLASSTPARPTPWDWYHAGVAAGVAGNAARSREAFARVLHGGDSGTQWLADLQDKTRALLDLLGDHQAFCTWASEAVADSRQQHKLTALTTAAFAREPHSPPTD